MNSGRVAGAQPMPVSTSHIAIFAILAALVVLRVAGQWRVVLRVRIFSKDAANPSRASLRLSWLTLAVAVLASIVASQDTPGQASPSTQPPINTALPAISASGYPRVITGDTIVIQGRRIRFFGIDAPDGGQACEDADGQVYDCGLKATVALVDHIAGGTVSCQARAIDRFRRTLAICHLGQEDLNAWMVENGWAVAYPHHSRDYALQQYMAKMDKLGIWAGSFMMPWEWRRQR